MRARELAGGLAYLLSRSLKVHRAHTKHARSTDLDVDQWEGVLRDVFALTRAITAATTTIVVEVAGPGGIIISL